MSFVRFASSRGTSLVGVAVSVTVTKGGLALQTSGLPPDVEAETHQSEAVPHKIVKGELIVDLPAWFYTEAARARAGKATAITGSLADVPLKHRPAGGHAVVGR